MLQYSFNVIPLLGEKVANDRDSYQVRWCTLHSRMAMCGPNSLSPVCFVMQYLVESIRQFPPQEKFQSMMQDVGFQRTSYTNYTHGVVALHSGFKF